MTTITAPQHSTPQDTGRRPASTNPLQHDIAERRSPALGGLNATMARIEFARTLRNRRTMMMALVMPVVLSLMVSSGSWQHEKYGRSSVAALVLVGMALYGAMVSTAGAGAAVSVERSAGWSRQLRLTPLSPVAYVTIKALTGMLLGGVSIVAVLAVGALRGITMPLPVALGSAVLVWAGSTIFAAFGLFMGYLLPTDNAMQLIGPMLAAFAFLGGLMMPINPDSTLGHIARFTPVWGVHQISLTPFGAGDFSWIAVANMVVWLAVFIGGAAWRMSKDTGRV